MTKNRELVVIVDEEARETLEGLSFRYFYDAKKQRDEEYVIETPLGRKRKVRGTLVKKPNFEEHAAEYVYLELNDVCNFACAYCGVRGDINHTQVTNLRDATVDYITPQFIEMFSGLIKVQPFAAYLRKFFYGGGEPLINPTEFSRVIDGFSRIQKTIHIVSTNGCNLPLDYDKFAHFMGSIGMPYIFITVSEEHKRFYEQLHKTGLKKLAEYVPQNVSPENALEEKIRIIGEHCKILGVGFTANVVEQAGLSEVEQDLRHYIIGSGIDIIATQLNGHRDPCSRGQEMAIRSNGDLYPHCYNIFTKTNKIGVVGFLLN